MKITRCQFYTIVFSIVGGISLGGNAYLLKKDRSSKKEISQLTLELDQKEYELDELKRLEEIGTVEDLNEYFYGKLRFFWDDYAHMFGYYSPQLTILRPEGAYGSVEISDALYQKINYVLSKYEIRSLRFQNLGDEIDLSKLDIVSPVTDSLETQSMNVEQVVIRDCKYGFQYEALRQLYPEDIELSTDEWNDQIKEWLANSYLKNRSITIASSNSYEYLKFFADTEKEIDTLRVFSNADEEQLKLLSKIKTKTIIIDSRSYLQEKLDFDLTLNEETEKIEFAFVNYDGITKEPNQLGNIKVSSPNPNLVVSIVSNPGILTHVNSITNISKNTHLELPENSTVVIDRINYIYEGTKYTLFGTFNYKKEETIEEMLKPLIEERKQKKLDG